MTFFRRSSSAAYAIGAVVGAVGLASVMIASLSTDAAAVDRMIGRAGAVRNQVDGVIGGVSRPMAAKDPIVVNQNVRTGVDSTAQLLFLDETSLNVGPNSDVKLDRFVYDPDRAKNDIVLTATKGVFRFVSGSSDPRSYHLKTPVATIGVRGTIYDTVIAATYSIIILVEGKLVIDLPNGKQVVLDKVGEAIRIDSAGHVEGPLTWDGKIFNVTGIVPYPLFGDSFLPADERFGDSVTRTENVNTIDAQKIIDGFRNCEGECGEGG